jgi:hypothetical protein
MQEAPHNTLPSAEQIRLAINTWFRGGGTTNLVINVCRREQATLAEAAALAERLGHRIANGKDFINDDVVSQQLEAVRAVVLSKEEATASEAKSPSPPIGSVEWHRRAAERALRSWRTLMGDVPMPSDPDEAERQYKARVYGQKWEGR